jgi:hypothetical protein
MEDFWGEPISTYTRADAIGDGQLVDVSEMAEEAGFRWPVAITKNLSADIADIPTGDTLQSYEGRLWDVLWMARVNARSSKQEGGDSEALLYELVMDTEDGPESSLYRVKMHLGGGDNGEPVITLMKPEET